MQLQLADVENRHELLRQYQKVSVDAVSKRIAAGGPPDDATELREQLGRLTETVEKFTKEWGEHMTKRQERRQLLQSGLTKEGLAELEKVLSAGTGGDTVRLPQLRRLSQVMWYELRSLYENHIRGVVRHLKTVEGHEDLKNVAWSFPALDEEGQPQPESRQTEVRRSWRASRRVKTGLCHFGSGGRVVQTS